MAWYDYLLNASIKSAASAAVNVGHTQIKTTQRYAHLSQDTLIDAANVMPFTMAMPMAVAVRQLPMLGL